MIDGQCSAGFDDIVGCCGRLNRLMTERQTAKSSLNLFLYHFQVLFKCFNQGLVSNLGDYPTKKECNHFSKQEPSKITREQSSQSSWEPLRNSYCGLGSTCSLEQWPNGFDKFVVGKGLRLFDDGMETGDGKTRG